MRNPEEAKQRKAAAEQRVFSELDLHRLSKHAVSHELVAKLISEVQETNLLLEQIFDQKSETTAEMLQLLETIAENTKPSAQPGA